MLREEEIRKLGERALAKKLEKEQKERDFLIVASDLWKRICARIKDDPKESPAKLVSPLQEYLEVHFQYNPPGSFADHAVKMRRYEAWISGISTWQARILGRLMRENPPVIGEKKLSRLNTGVTDLVFSAHTMDMRGYHYPEFGRTE